MDEQLQGHRVFDGGKMYRFNWVLVFSGIALFFFGFVALAAVGKEYHGFKGFLAPAMLMAGLIVIVAGFVLHKHPEKGE